MEEEVKDVMDWSIPQLEDDKLYKHGSMIATGKWWKDSLPGMLAAQRDYETKLMWSI